MATNDATALGSAVPTDAPTVQIRCLECGYVHLDDRFETCRECGAML